MERPTPRWSRSLDSLCFEKIFGEYKAVSRNDGPLCELVFLRYAAGDGKMERRVGY